MTFHFAYYRGTADFPFRDIHALCLRSCFKNTGAQTIVVHYDQEGEGPFWKEARDLSGIVWRKADFITDINGIPVSDQRIICDRYRLHILNTEGGFFCDLDFVFLSSFDKLRHHPAIIGTQCRSKQKLACGLMGAEPGSAFIRAYIDSYKSWTLEDQKKFWNYANTVPWNLSKIHPVHVLPRSTFYPWCWSNKTFLRGGPINMKSSVAIHLWETLQPTMTVVDLQKTVIKEKIADILGVSRVPHILNKPGGFLVFD